MQTNKNEECPMQKMFEKFHEKDIYTIQQFQYRKESTYKWSLEFFNKLGIDEWDSFCEQCLMYYSKESSDARIKSRS